jgi:nucleotide-binding universal stress UspA family protein
MFKHILVPLDGTPFAEAALPVASRLALESHAGLHLVLSHRLVPALVGFEGIVVPPLTLDTGLQALEHTYLVETAEKVRLGESGPVDYQETDGPAGPAVAEEALRVGADLIVMVTHWRGLAGRVLHGAVADHLIRHLHVPVLLLRQGTPQARLETGQPRGILVALDLSVASEGILGPVQSLAEMTGGPITLLHVMGGPARGKTPLDRSVDAIARRTAIGQELEALAEPLRRRGRNVCTRVERGINAAMTIHRIAAEAQYDVLAITTHGYGGLRRMLMGAVAERLIHRVLKPVLVLRPTR